MRLDKNFYCKYIHLLYGHDTKFSGLLLKFFNDAKNGFDISQHLFVTPYKNVFDELHEYPNVIFDDSGKNLYIRYYRHCDLMISHSSEPLSRILLTPPSVKRKVVYRYWGGLQISQQASESNASLKIWVKKQIIKWSFYDFAAIGVANSTDINDLSRILKKDTRYYRLSYTSNDYYVIAEKLKEEMATPKVSRHKTKVLLGHRGTEENNHIEIIKKLNVYDPEKFDIYVPLSYGNQQYIQKVEEYIENNSKGNIITLKDFMPLQEYIEFLSTIDIAIFDGYTSYALGNISLILFFKKTIYLNENGIIAKTLEIENNKYRKISDIGNIAYDEFAEPMIYANDFHSDLCIVSPEEQIKNWNQLLSDFG